MKMPPTLHMGSWNVLSSIELSNQSCFFAEHFWISMCTLSFSRICRAPNTLPSPPIKISLLEEYAVLRLRSLNIMQMAYNLVAVSRRAVESMTVQLKILVTKE